MNSQASYFFHTLVVDVDKLRVSKEFFAEAIKAEGIDINPSYKYIVSEWNWIKKYLKVEPNTKNAISFRNRSFNILFNEKYTDDDVEDIIKAIEKVEKILAL